MRVAKTKCGYPGGTKQIKHPMIRTYIIYYAPHGDDNERRVEKSSHDERSRPLLLYY